METEETKESDMTINKMQSMSSNSFEIHNSVPNNSMNMELENVVPS